MGENLIHVHEILGILANSQEEFTIDSLKDKVDEKFGENCNFTNCSGNSFNFEEILDFMVSRGKISIEKDNIIFNAENMCNH